MIWTFNFRTIHAGFTVNFTGTNLSKNRRESKIPNRSIYLMYLSILKKTCETERDMQNDTPSRS